jgi:hypothetical protein
MNYEELINSFSKDKGSQKEQRMFCHMECLKKAISSKFPYILLGIGTMNLSPNATERRCSQNENQ